MRARPAVLAVVAAAALVGSSCFGAEGGRTYSAEFARAVQVFPGVKVKVLGVDVGRVTDIENSKEAVRVTFRIDDPDVKIPADAHATLVPLSLLGERYVQLFPAYTGGPTLEDGSNIGLSQTSVPAEGDELLQAMQDYLGELDGKTVEDFVSNAAEVLDGKGKRLNRLIDYGTTVLETLSSRRNELADMIVQFDRLTQALATRQDAIGRLLNSYNVVTATIHDVRSSVEGTITGLSDASAAIGDLLSDHRRPLAADIASLTRTTRTLNRSVDQFAETGHWAKRLFLAASRAVDYEQDWLRLGDQTADPLGDLIVARLGDRLVGLCLRLGDPQCARGSYWEQAVPELFCLSEKGCGPKKKPAAKKRGRGPDVEGGGGGSEIEQGLEKLDDEVQKVVDKALKKKCKDAKHPKKCRKRKRDLRKQLPDLGGLDDTIGDVVDGLGGGLIP